MSMAGEQLGIKGNIEKVRSRIQQAAKRSGRNEREVSLIAVTKQKSAAVVKELVDCGITKIGESYLQEATFKIDLLAGLGIEWTMIGNIQRGKEKGVARLFQEVHSVGSLGTARELDKFAAGACRRLAVFLADCGPKSRTFQTRPNLVGFFCVVTIRWGPACPAGVTARPRRSPKYRQPRQKRVGCGGYFRRPPIDI